MADTASSSELLRSLLALAEKKTARRTGEHRLPSPEVIEQELKRRAAAAKVAPTPPEAPAAPPEMPTVPPRRSADGMSLAEVQYRVLVQTRSTPDAANSVVDLLCLVAQADGVINEAEREALAVVLKALMGTHLHEAVVKHLIRSSLREIASQGVDKKIATIGATLLTCQLAEDGLVLAMMIAYTGDGLTAPERAILKKLAASLRIAPERLDALVDRVRAEMMPA